MLDSILDRFTQRESEIAGRIREPIDTGLVPVVRLPFTCAVRSACGLSAFHFAWTSFLRCLAAALIGVYVAWNVFWLAQLKLAPSIFESITGIPCATTGGTRGFLSAVQGDWQTSLFHNPMTLPIIAILVASIAIISAKALRGQPVRLPHWVFVSWLLVLSVAWGYKISQWAWLQFV